MLDKRTGKTLWSVDGDFNEVGSSADIVYASTSIGGNAALEAFDERSGSLLWILRSPLSDLIPAPTGVVAKTEDGLSFVDSAGRLQWTRKAPTGSFRSITLYGHYVIAVGAESGSVLHTTAQVLDLKSGKLLAELPFDDITAVRKNTIFAVLDPVEDLNEQCHSADIGFLKIPEIAFQRTFVYGSVIYVLNPKNSGAQYDCARRVKPTPDVFIGDTLVALSSGQIVALFESGNGSAPVRTFTDAKVLGVSEDGATILLAGSSIDVLSRKKSLKHYSRIASTDSSPTTAMLYAHRLFVGSATHLDIFDQDTGHRIATSLIDCSEIIPIRREKTENLVACLDSSQKGNVLQIHL